MFLVHKNASNAALRVLLFVGLEVFFQPSDILLQPLLCFISCRVPQNMFSIFPKLRIILLVCLLYHTSNQVAASHMRWKQSRHNCISQNYLTEFMHEDRPHAGSVLLGLTQVGHQLTVHTSSCVQISPQIKGSINHKYYKVLGFYHYLYHYHFHIYFQDISNNPLSSKLLLKLLLY